MDATSSKVSDFTFRAVLRSGDLSGLPFEVARQIEAIRARMWRHEQRWLHRETKSQQYASVGLNGKRAVARRLRQIDADTLRVSL